MKSEEFPTVVEMISMYWPILLITLAPSIAGSLMTQMFAKNVFAVGFLLLLPFLIFVWLIKIGLNLHIVDRHIENVGVVELLKRGRAFWKTIFRAILLLIGLATLILIPLMIMLYSIGDDGAPLAMVIAGLIMLKWNLFLTPVLFRDRRLVKDAWRVVKSIQLKDHLGLVGLYVVSLLFMLIPYREISPTLSIPF